MDPHGYPEGHELRRIRNYGDDFHGLMDYVKYLWKYPDRITEFHSTCEDGKVYRIVSVSTGGWSGNEDIVDALQKNHSFWMICWHMSKRGGYHEFRIRETRDVDFPSTKKD
jgi:hypothetical protein